jgi:CBS domain-containing protein
MRRVATTARDVMTVEVISVCSDESLLVLDTCLRTAGVSGVPVIDDGELVGIVSRSDIGRQISVESAQSESAHEFDEQWRGPDPLREEKLGAELGERLAKLSVADAMIRNVDTISPDTPLKEVAAGMLETHHRRLVVVDDGVVIGIVTATDLVALIRDGWDTD